MNPPTATLPRRPAAARMDRPPRPRGAAVSPGHAWSPFQPARTAHDFLVPNPRPDLTFDLNTLRMLEAG